MQQHLGLCAGEEGERRERGGEEEGGRRERGGGEEGEGRERR